MPVAWRVADGALRGLDVPAHAGIVAHQVEHGEVHALGAFGVLAGAVPYFACVKLKSWLKYDDALDTFGVHGVGGTLGAILTGVFAAWINNQPVTLTNGRCETSLPPGTHTLTVSPDRSAPTLKAQCDDATFLDFKNTRPLNPQRKRGPARGNQFPRASAPPPIAWTPPASKVSKRHKKPVASNATGTPQAAKPSRAASCAIAADRRRPARP